MIYGSNTLRLGGPSLWKNGGLAGLANLALARVGAAALNDQVAENFIVARTSCASAICSTRSTSRSRPASSVLLHRVEMRPQVIDSEGSRKISLIPARKQLGHMPEVAQAVVDRSGREHEELFGRTVWSSKS